MHNKYYVQGFKSTGISTPMAFQNLKEIPCLGPMKDIFTREAPLLTWMMHYLTIL